MKRISFETAKLAAEKGYPTCQQQYYISQYSLSSENNIIYHYSKRTCELYSDLIPALYQAELQEWLRNEHGVSVLVYLDETLSYFWVVTNLDTKVSIEGYHGPEKVQCKHYEACLEEGLRIALRLLWHTGWRRWYLISLIS